MRPHGPQGWYRDPYGNHGERWFSDGQPTDLVRDQGTQSYNEPPRPLPPLPPLLVWRWWTVCLPGALALAAAVSFLFYAAFGATTDCLTGCTTATEGMPVGAAGTVVAAIGAATLLVAGLTAPIWRRACAAGLWVAFALACICGVLIVIASPTESASASTGSRTFATSLDAAACTAIGGRVLESNAVCFGVPYISDTGQLDYGQVWYDAHGQLTGRADTVGTGATRAECDSGKYPEGPTGPVTRKPGQWDAQLSLCKP